MSAAGFAKVSGAHEMRVSTIDALINVTSDCGLDKIIPEDALVVKLCDEHKAKCVIVDNKGIFYLAAFYRTTIEKNIDKALLSTNPDAIMAQTNEE